MCTVFGEGTPYYFIRTCLSPQGVPNDVIALDPPGTDTVLLIV